MSFLQNFFIFAEFYFFNFWIFLKRSTTFLFFKKTSLTTASWNVSVAKKLKAVFYIKFLILCDRTPVEHQTYYFFVFDSVWPRNKQQFLGFWLVTKSCILNFLNLKESKDMQLMLLLELNHASLLKDVSQRDNFLLSKHKINQESYKVLTKLKEVIKTLS